MSTRLEFPPVNWAAPDFNWPMAQADAQAIGRPFRGTITDYARTIELGSGYIGSWADDNLCRNCRAKEIAKCRHFEIDTARHLAGPFQAIGDPNVRVVMILKAAQTAGSLTWDMALHYLIVHTHYMRIKALLDSEEKARRYSDHRLMETLKANPDIRPLLPGTGGQERHDLTKTEIKFNNGKTLIVGGLNDSNASSLPSDVIIVDEGWMHQSDGLMRKAIDRTKQIKDRKVILVGQAGLKNEDQDRLWEGLHRRVPLTWACPCCGGRQAFELTKLRPDDFVPRPPLEYGVASAAVGMLALPPAPPKPGTYCGFKIPKRFSELTTPEEIKAAAALTTIECYWCAFTIPDTRPMRAALMASYEQDYQVNGLTPLDYEVGFWNPDPASVTVPFAQTMHEYIVAKKADDDFQNKVPLRDFYMNRWATAWDPDLVKVIRAQTQERYDRKSDWPEEWRGHRCLIVDCQQDLQYFWASVWAVSTSGKSRQLWRGILHGFGDAKKDFKEQPETLAGKQKEFGVLDQFTFLDGGYMKNELVEECAKHGHWATSGGERDWYCWTLLIGSGQKDFSHKADQNSKVRHPVSDPFYEYPHLRVDKYRVSVEVYYFSALQMGDMWVRYRDGHGPETLFLPETDSLQNPLSWTAQINAPTKHPSVSNRTGEVSEVWKPLKQSTPHHFFDVGRMFMAVQVIWGISGHYQFAAPAEAGAEESVAANQGVTGEA